MSICHPVSSVINVLLYLFIILSFFPLNIENKLQT